MYSHQIGGHNMPYSSWMESKVSLALCVLEREPVLHQSLSVERSRLENDVQRGLFMKKVANLLVKRGYSLGAEMNEELRPKRKEYREPAEPTRHDTPVLRIRTREDYIYYGLPVPRHLV